LHSNAYCVYPQSAPLVQNPLRGDLADHSRTESVPPFCPWHPACHPY
jgi:hypothetical protein